MGVEIQVTGDRNWIRYKSPDMVRLQVYPELTEARLESAMKDKADSLLEMMEPVLERKLFDVEG